MAVYDTTSRDSFEHIKLFVNEIQTKEIPISLSVGNKVDRSDERKVTTSEGKALASRFGFEFREISATAAKEVEDMFSEIVNQFCQKTRL